MDEQLTAVAIVSGGLDSTTMLYDAQTHGVRFTSCVSFNYGQRHKKELEFARHTAEKLGIRHHLIDLWASGLTAALVPSGSSLVDMDTPVPDGHYAEETMKQTVVPNRNMIMIALAGGIAVAEGAMAVMTGVHSGDHFIYPDCRPQFIAACGITLAYANEGFAHEDFGLMAPFLDCTKAEIAYRALELNIPLSGTWSCYKGGDVHCGRCGTCVERLEAIAIAQDVFRADGLEVPQDDTVYEDTEYWMEVVNNANR